MTLTIALNIVVLLTEVIYNDKSARPLSFEESVSSGFSLLKSYNVDVSDLNKYIKICDSFFLAIYLVEFCLKVYCDPTGYWKGKGNIMDFIILVVSFVQMTISKQSDSAAQNSAANSVKMVRISVNVKGKKYVISYRISH